MIDPWYLENLVCPVERTPLALDGEELVSSSGRRYPVVEGMPILLVEGAPQTIGHATAAVRRAWTERAPETIGLNANELEAWPRLSEPGRTKIDPFVLLKILATSGYAYQHLRESETLAEYPVPTLSLPLAGPGEVLDIGCNWGRWSFAAARLGHRVVGIDPSLGAVLAARRVATALGLDARFVCGDARFLPFAEGRFDGVFSYSVLQHLGRADCAAAVAEIGRVLKPGGVSKVQMANALGLRSLQHQFRRGFRDGRAFEVRYWSNAALKRMFEAAVGPTRITADCYFGLGWQWSDYRFMRLLHRPILAASEGLRRASQGLPPLRSVADSVFCTSTKSSGHAC